MRSKRKVILVLLTVVYSGLAFQVHHRPYYLLSLRKKDTHLRVGEAMPLEDNTNSDEGLHSVILAGTSPKAIRLRKRLKEVWSSPKTSPVVIIGPKGSGKSLLVEELLDRLPSSQKQSIHRLSMDDAVNHIDTMLGLETQPGLLDLLSDEKNTTLVLTSFQSRHVESADEFGRRQELFQTLAKLISDRTFHSCYEGKEKPFAPRIIATCTRQPEFLDDSSDVFLVKVPALESRTQDMEAIATQEIKLYEKSYGLENVKMSSEAVHRLLDHRWEVCASELDEEVRNALELLAIEKQQDPETPNVLQSKHMLVNSFNESMRRRLLYDFPVLRKIIQSPWVFDHTLRYIVTPVFVLTLAALFLGPQTRDHNTALTYFWAGWWPLVMLSYPFLGRIWCSICPFMAVGNLAQETVTRFGVELKKWPKWVNTFGAAFAFGLFFAILMWEELWNLPQSGTLSAYLLLLITSGAVFNSVQFEKRVWCRYLCPIGAMCRVFGTVSLLEVRSWKANCEGCTNAQCLKGMSPAVDPSDTFALKGCTMNLKNNQLRDMGDVRKNCVALVLKHSDLA
jgi:GTPase SAR1 family protein